MKKTLLLLMALLWLGAANKAQAQLDEYSYETDTTLVDSLREYFEVFGWFGDDTNHGQKIRMLS